MKARMFKAIAAAGAAFLLAGCTLDPEPASLAFGKVYVGLVRTLPVKWTNHGNREASVLGGSATKAPYTMVGNVAGAVKANESTPTVQIAFAPTAAGQFPEEARIASTGVSAVKVQMTGEGVWAKNEGGFSLENMPTTTTGTLTFGSSPIQPNQPIDWGTRKLGNPATNAEFFVRNSNPNPVNDTAIVSLAKGDQNFTIIFPSTAGTGMGISAGANGTREIRVQFNPAALGEFSDVVEVTDSANPAAKAGIVLKAKVTETGE